MATRKLRDDAATEYGTGEVRRVVVRRGLALHGPNEVLEIGAGRSGVIDLGNGDGAHLQPEEVRELRDSLSGWLRLIGRKRANAAAGIRTCPRCGSTQRNAADRCAGCGGVVP